MSSSLAAALWNPAVSFDVAEEKASVARYFGARAGAFVEVGAFDPVLKSQTLHLERRGWTGLLVEPNSKFAAKLRAKRKVPVAQVACGSPAQHGTTMAFRERKEFSTLADDFARPGLVAKKIGKVRVATLNSLLAKFRLKHVDFVSIDVEGFEKEVLKGFSLERYRPSLVLLEDHVRDLSLHRLMTGRGYKLVRRTCLNSWYVPQSVDFPVSLFGRLQFLRKYVLGTPLRAAKHRLRMKAAVWFGSKQVGGSGGRKSARRSARGKRGKARRKQTARR